MKTVQNKNIELFNCKSFGIAALISILWLGGASSSFGSVTINLDSNLDPCSGAVNVYGDVLCPNCESSPAVGIVCDSGGSGSEPILPTVYGGCGNNPGTYDETTVYLAAGINIISVSDTCGGSDSIAVPSNGGSGNGWNYGPGVNVVPYISLLMPIVVTCIDPDVSYYVFEDDIYYLNGEACDGDRMFMEFPGSSAGHGSQKVIGWVDILQATGPHETGFNTPCDTLIAKEWNVYDHDDPSSGVLTRSGDVVDFLREENPNKLTISDSQVSAAPVFN